MWVCQDLELHHATTPTRETTTVKEIAKHSDISTTVYSTTEREITTPQTEMETSMPQANVTSHSYETEAAAFITDATQIRIVHTDTTEVTTSRKDITESTTPENSTKETSPTDEATTPQMEVTSSTPEYDAESITLTTVQPITFPTHTITEELPIPIPCVDEKGATQIVSYNITDLLDTLDSNTPQTHKDIIFNFLRQPETYKILAGLKPLPSSVTTTTTEITTREPITRQPMPTTCADDIDGSQTLVVNIGTLFEALDENTPQEVRSTAEEFLAKGDIFKKLQGFDFEVYETRAELLQELLTFLKSETHLPDKVSQALEVLQGHILTTGMALLPPDIKTECTNLRNLQEQDITLVPLQSDITFPITKPTLPLKPIKSFKTNPQDNGFDARLYFSYGSLLKGILTYLRSKIHMERYIGEVIESILPHIQMEGPRTLVFNASIACNISNALVIERTNEFTDFVHDNTVTYIPYAASNTVYISRETEAVTTLQEMPQTQATSGTKSTTSDSTTLQSSNISSQDQENIFTCPDNQIKTSIYNVTALLEVVNENVSSDHISIVKNLFQRKDTVTLLQGLNLEQIKTRAHMLTKLITSVKFIYPILEPSLNKAFNDILNNIHFDGIGSMTPDFMWVCQDMNKKLTTPTTQTILTDTRKHPESYTVTQTKTQQTNAYTTHIISGVTDTPLRVTTQTTGPYTLPTVVQLVYEENVTTVY